MRVLRLEADVIAKMSYFKYNKPVPELKNYPKDELMTILNEEYPDALAKIPAPETFEIKTNNSNGVDNLALHVCHTVPR
jgi:hypothetical protein